VRCRHGVDISALAAVGGRRPVGVRHPQQRQMTLIMVNAVASALRPVSSGSRRPMLAPRIGALTGSVSSREWWARTGRPSKRRSVFIVVVAVFVCSASIAHASRRRDALVYLVVVAVAGLRLSAVLANTPRLFVTWRLHVLGW